MSDRWDAEANEICAAIGFNVGRSMIATALRQAYREGCRDMGKADSAHLQAQREKVAALEERDAAYRALAYMADEPIVQDGMSRTDEESREYDEWLARCPADFGAVIEAARKMGDE